MAKYKVPPGGYRKCADCRHELVSWSQWIFGHGHEHAKCGHPKTQDHKRVQVEDVHLGGMIVGREPPSCNLLRDGWPSSEPDRVCGREARYFEGKP